MIATTSSTTVTNTKQLFTRNRVVYPALPKQHIHWAYGITRPFPNDISSAVVSRFHVKFKSIYYDLLREGFSPRQANHSAATNAVEWFEAEWKPLAENAAMTFSMDEKKIAEFAKRIISEITGESLHAANSFDLLDDGEQGLYTEKLSIGAIRKSQLTIIKSSQELCKNLNIPFATGNIKAQSAKYLTTAFWTRKIKRSIYPERENIARKAGMIGKKASPYSTAEAQHIRNKQLKRTEVWASHNYAVNPDTKEPISMTKIMKTSVDSYRARIIAKATGLNKLKAENNWKAAMITVTCPGAFRVGKIDEHTISECIDYMRKIQKRISAAISDEKLQIAGMQVPQPHQDGTPHQHMYVIGEEADIQRFYDIIKDRATELHPNESNASEIRTELDWEDRARGGALSTYVLSYVLRFTTPEKEALGITDNKKEYQEASAEKNGSAEDSYYYMNGLRRVGWFGLPADYAWEAARRISKSYATSNPELLPIREAALNGDYATFTNLMGGIAIPRKERPYKPLTEQQTSYAGETYNRYVGAIIFGISIRVKGNSWSLISGLNMNYPRGDKSPESDDLYDDMDEIICLWAIPEPIPI